MFEQEQISKQELTEETKVLFFHLRSLRLFLLKLLGVFFGSEGFLTGGNRGNGGLPAFPSLFSLFAPVHFLVLCGC